jgi:hypothetical protein
MHDPSEWYTKEELCIYETWRSNMSYANVSGRCNADAEVAIAFADRATDRLGEAKRPSERCAAPLSSNSYFMKTLAGFSSPKSNGLIEAALAIHTNNRALIFVGDGVTQQSMFAFFTELHRLDKGIYTEIWKNKASENQAAHLIQCSAIYPHNHCICVRLNLLVQAHLLLNCTI